MASVAEKIQKKETCAHQEECMKMVQLIVDGQATCDQIAAFKVSMDKCLPCEKGYELEKCIKDAMKGKVVEKKCPGSLIALIRAKIARC